MGAAARDVARIAVYYAPTLSDPLHRAGAAWLGRDAETNAAVPQPDAPGIAEATQDARRYGFHCTLKPPFRLAGGWHYTRVVDAAARLAGQLRPFDLPPLEVAEIGGFLALRETSPCLQLRFLADCCVEQLDPCRAPSSPSELERRRRAGLTVTQERMLARWGYPHVFEAWFFHMTLTRRLGDVERRPLRAAAERHFAAALAEPRQVSDVCLFTQREPGAPFVLAERLPMRA